MLVVSFRLLYAHLLAGTVRFVNRLYHGQRGAAVRGGDGRLLARLYGADEVIHLAPKHETFIGSGRARAAWRAAGFG
jgi:hypothetical protein